MSCYEFPFLMNMRMSIEPKITSHGKFLCEADNKTFKTQEDQTGTAHNHMPQRQRKISKKYSFFIPDFLGCYSSLSVS